MRLSRLVLSFVVLSCVSLVSACSGGGGGGSATTSVPPPANSSPTADSQSLSTEENTPLDIMLTGSDADGDSLDFTIASEPVNGTLSGSAPDLTYTPDADFGGDDAFTFQVSDGSAASAEATVSITVIPLYAIGGTVTGAINTGLTLENNGTDSLEVAGTGFEFADQLADGASYEVSVAAPPDEQLCSVSNASSTVAAADVDNVAVLCRSWRTAAAIETDTGEATSPQISFDAAGNAVAVWIQNDGVYDRVMSNTYTAGVGWGSATQVSASTGDAQSPQILVDSDGDALATWSQMGPTYTNLWVNLYQAGSGWGTAGFIEYNDGDVRNPQVALDEAAGNGLIVWEQDTAPGPAPSNVWAIEYSSGSGWGTAELIESSFGNARVPQVAFDSTGKAIAVWQQYDGSARDDIRANTWSPTDGWGTATEIETTDAGSSRAPQLVIDSTDKATVVWSSDDGSRFNIWATTYTEAGGWTSDVLIETDNAGDAYDPQLATDSVGNLVAVWRQHDGVRFNTVANAYSVDSGWGTAETIESHDGTAAEPQVAMDGDGNAIAVWRSYDIWANTWTPANGWSTAQQIETDAAGMADKPQLGFDPEGNAIAVWMESDATRNNIQSNRFE